jgi:hypothetical protein
MTEYVGNIIPSPNYAENAAVTTDEELLASTQGGFTQKGVTLKAGQGVLAIGTVLAKDSVTRKYVKYDNTGTNGANVAVGILRNSVDTGADTAAPSQQANIVITGILNLALVQNANASAALAAATTAFGARSSAALGTFTF